MFEIGIMPVKCGPVASGESPAPANDVYAAIKRVQDRFTTDIRAVDAIDPESIEDHCGTIVMRVRPGSNVPVDAIRADAVRILAPLGYTQIQVLTR